VRRYSCASSFFGFLENMTKFADFEDNEDFKETVAYTLGTVERAAYIKKFQS
jgi:hypothetical protein